MGIRTHHRARTALAIGLAVGIAGIAVSTGGCRTHPLADRESVAREAIEGYVSRGEAALAELEPLLEDEDPRIRQGAKQAVSRITGQWGSLSDGIVWKRSLEEATGHDRPILMLHLFGNFDEEFC